MKPVFFVWIVVLTTLAVVPAADAAPMTQPLGSATATLTLDSDPPSTGAAHALLAIAGVPPAALSSTTITFGSAMPAMNMTGKSGVAHRVAPGRYEFDLALGMAATWSVTIHATGGVNGTTTFTFPVASSGGSPQPLGMGSTAAGSGAGPWRTAAFVLLAILIAFAVVSRRIRSPWALGVLGAAALIAIGVAALQAYVDAQPGSTGGMDMNAMIDVKGDAPIAVRTIALVRAGPAAGPTMFAPGTLAPYLLEDIVARSPGSLQDVSIYAGDRVKAGQVLAHLSAPELVARAAASSAEAAAQAHSADAAAIDASTRAPANVIAMRADARAAKLEAEGAVADLAAKNERRRSWQAELARERMLLAQGAVSEQEFEDERAQAAAADADATMAFHRMHATREQVTAAQAKVVDATASAQIAHATAEALRAQAGRAAEAASGDAVLAGYGTVVAPMNGIVLKRLIDPGTYVQSGTVIATIAVVDRLRVQANVSDAQIPSVSIGTRIVATTSDGMVLHGRVSSVAPVADATTRTTAVEAIVDNPGRRAVPGGYVRVVFSERSPMSRSSMRVPLAAVVSAGETPAVWRVADGTAERVPVRVVSDDGRDAYVTGVLHAGDRIVVDGATDLQPGVRVAEAAR